MEELTLLAILVGIVYGMCVGKGTNLVGQSYYSVNLKSAG